MKMTSGPENESQFIKMKSVHRITTFAVRKAWFNVGKDLIADAKSAIKKKPRQGRVYRVRTRGGRVRRHVASLPGESHANLTGALLRAVSWKVHGPDLEFGYGVIEKDAPDHAQMVENGTKNMKARPSIRNAVNKNIRNAERELSLAVKQGFDK